MDFLRQHARWTAGGIAVVLIIAYAIFLAPPSDFPKGDMIVIAKGSSLPEVARQLADVHVVKREAVLWFILRMTGASGRIQAGPYLFERPQNAFTIAYRLVTGDSGIPAMRITFPEGMTSREMAERVHEAFPSISEADFIAVAKPQEGYLFPDTYLFPPDSTPESIVAAMRKNFDKKIESLMSEVRASGHSVSSVVIMASLIEKEARTAVNRKIVSGILWDRLAIGMPLQVDAVFGYINNRDTYSPSYADLAVKSPYNTYLYKGLPSGPIANPGIDALRAALHPTKTDYLYYLTDREGVMHYATTYAGHQANQTKYLH